MPFQPLPFISCDIQPYSDFCLLKEYPIDPFPFPLKLLSQSLFFLYSQFLNCEFSEKLNQKPFLPSSTLAPFSSCQIFLAVLATLLGERKYQCLPSISNHTLTLSLITQLGIA
jgi:hypothetical protein